VPSSYAVIGSGPSGANAALTLLERGKEVVMYDVGIEEKPFPHPQATFNDLKELLDDPHSFFLGSRLQGIIPPGSEEIFDYPPSRDFRVSPDNPWIPHSRNGFRPVLSLNRGGLGVAWGANCLPYTDDDLRDFPIKASDLSEGYETASKRMVISGPGSDDLSPFLGKTFESSEPVRFNRHDSLLWNRYQKKKKRVEKCGVVLGRARLAVDNREGSEHRCIYCDRCLWGCGPRAIYNPVTTLEACQKYPQFRYRPNACVTRLGIESGSVRTIHFFDTKEKREDQAACNQVLLAAGAIGSGAIFLRTLKNDADVNGRFPLNDFKTRSLLDTEVVKIPYLIPTMIGRKNPDSDFQFNKLIMGYLNRDRTTFPRYIHAEVLSLTSLLYHPLIESLPFGTHLSSRIFFALRPALGVATLFLPDRPYGGNGMRLSPEADPNSPARDRTEFFYKNDPSREALRRDTIGAVKAALRRLGCFVPGGREMSGAPGSGIHYAGTIPMSAKEDPLSVDRNGRSFAYQNLSVADGASFPTLPSKSITFNLVANAIRVAATA